MRPLAIVLLTYNRWDCAEKTLRSALDNISYSGKLSVHIADDGTGHDYRMALKELAGGYDKVQGVSVSDSERGGYGKNYNLAMQTVHQFAELVLPLEDDWELLRPLDLDPLALVLDDERVGCVRMGYLGATQSLRGEMLIIQSHLWFLMDWDSAERHIFAGHPRLETVEWERQVGPWPEGLDPNMTEFNVSAFEAARQKVVWPTWLLPTEGNLFVHIGTERSRHDLDGEAVLVGG